MYTPVEWFLIIYGFGFVISIYSAVFEFIMLRSPIKTKDWQQIIMTSIFFWYILVPWIWGDFVYVYIKKRIQ